MAKASDEVIRLRAELVDADRLEREHGARGEDAVAEMHERRY